MPANFRTVELGSGVFAAVGDIAGAAVGNAAIIDMGDKTLVIDSFMTASAAEELRAEVMRLTGKSAFLLVNTHWHSDHTWGNQVFADTPIASTARTVELMIADAPADLSAYEADLEGLVATLRAQAESDDPAVRAEAQRRLPGAEAWRAAAPGLRITLPDVLFEDRLVIEGERRVELITFGGGHTDSDVFAWLPEERTVIAGDLCWNRIHPRTQDGHPGPWAAILEKMVALGPERIHPGHGEPGDRGVAEALIPYLRAVDALVAATRAGADPATLAAPPGSETWDGLARMRTGVTRLAARDGGATKA